MFVHNFDGKKSFPFTCQTQLHNFPVSCSPMREVNSGGEQEEEEKEGLAEKKASRVKTQLNAKLFVPFIHMHAAVSTTSLISSRSAFDARGSHEHFQTHLRMKKRAPKKRRLMWMKQKIFRQTFPSRSTDKVFQPRNEPFFGCSCANTQFWKATAEKQGTWNKNCCFMFLSPSSASLRLCSDDEDVELMVNDDCNPKSWSRSTLECYYAKYCNFQTSEHSRKSFENQLKFWASKLRKFQR